MGIQGLLPFLKDATEAINIRKYKGHAVAVDTYCWIHRGAVACSLQLAKGEKCDQYVRYCLKYVNMLLSLDIKPVLVFDGQHLPAKKSVEDSRRKRRELYSQKGKQLLREGKASEARDAFVKCINVTSEMALEVMKAVRSLDVDCIVAPYEADAQLAYLEKCGYVQAIITEDSDLMAFGCKRVIFKMDTAGNALEINQTRLNQAVKMGTRFSVEKFRHMCILAGCDYLPSLPGVGLGKARKYMHTVSNLDIQQFLKRMPLQLKLKTSVSQEYIDGFVQANNTFLYQLVFDPMKRKLLPLNPYPPELAGEEMDYAGSYMDSKLSFELALGNVEINKIKRIFNFKPVWNKPYPKGTPLHKLSIWHHDYHLAPPLQSDDPCNISRKPTKGQEVSIPSKGFMKSRSLSKKRLREDGSAVQANTSDAALTSLYGGSPEAKTLRLEEPETIPETPSPDKNQDKNVSLPAKPTPRNIFAIKKSQRMDSDTRRDLLNSEVTVSSRFFQTGSTLSSEKVLSKPEKTEEDLVTSQEGTDNIYTPKVLDDGSDSQFDLEEDAPVMNDSIRNHQRKVRGTTGRLCDKNIDRTSVLDSLQKFRHSEYDGGQSQIKEEFDLKQKKKSSPLSQSRKRQRKGVFSWSNKSPSSNSTQKTLTDSIKGLSAFHRNTRKPLLQRSNTTPSQEKGSQSSQVDTRLSQEDSVQSDMMSSQTSFISSVGSFSQLSIDSIDRDGPTLSQVLGSDAFTLSKLGETSQGKNSASPVKDQKACVSPGDEALCNVLVDIAQEGEAVSEMETSTDYSSQEEQSVTSKSNFEDDDDEKAIANVADTSESHSSKIKLFPANSDRTPVLPSLKIQEEVTSSQRSHIFFGDDSSNNDENSPPVESRRRQAGEKITSLYFKKNKEGECNSGKRPEDIVRSLGLCKVPGLSKKQKRKPSTLQLQPTLMAFMTKKPPARSSKEEPLSPSRLEALQNITPEADAVYVMDKAATVRKNIFK